jgi:hypothetical protein
VLSFPRLLIPLAAPGWRVAAFGVGLAFLSFGAVVYNVAQVSYRQAICPPRLLGRMNAAIRWVDLPGLEDQRAPRSGVPGHGGRELPDGAGPQLGD